jgi:hypothetical protein
VLAPYPPRPPPTASEIIEETPLLNVEFVPFELVEDVDAPPEPTVIVYVVPAVTDTPDEKT